MRDEKATFWSRFLYLTWSNGAHRVAFYLRLLYLVSVLIKGDRQGVSNAGDVGFGIGRVDKL